jgi:Glyoxalase-like domain
MTTIMSNMPNEIDCSDWQLVKPIMTSRKMTTWKSGLKFQPEGHLKASAGTDIGTLNRLRKTGTQLKKGSFQKKNKVADAPNLVSVVSATQELKERAKADARARHLKIEEYRKFKSSRTIVKKQPLEQPKNQWQNMITKNGHTKKSKPSTFASKKKKAKSTGDLAIADWKAAYQDILSPNSGNRRFVARRDLAAVEKVTSPKKKVRAKARSASATLFSRTPLLVENDTDAHPKDDAFECSKPDGASVLSKMSSKKMPLSVTLSVDDTESVKSAASSDGLRNQNISARTSAKFPVLVSPISERDEKEVESINEGNLNNNFNSNSIKKPFISLEAEDEEEEEKRNDEFVDFDDFDDPSETMDVDFRLDEPPLNEEEMVESNKGEASMDLNASMHSEKTPHAGESHSPRFDEAEPIKEPPRKSKSKTLILEFSMPSLTGESQHGDDDDDIGLEVPVDVYSYGDISSVGSWPSIESEDSYETRMHKMMQRWMDVDDGDENDKTDNDVQLDDNVLDHVVLAAPDLEKAMEQFHEMTGIMPVHVGPLQGLGAKTAHVGLDNNRYIEILAPDSDDPGPLGDELKCLDENTLTPYHYAIRSSEVSRLIEGYVYDVIGWDPDHIAMVQALPDDSIRQWDLLTMYGHDMGGVAPYYVRWIDPTHHPTSKIPANATLTSCRVVAPEEHDVHKLITGVGGIDIETGAPKLECVIETPKGTVIFSADSPKGLVFPGYDEE